MHSWLFAETNVASRHRFGSVWENSFLFLLALIVPTSQKGEGVTQPHNTFNWLGNRKSLNWFILMFFLHLPCWHTAKGLNDLRHLTPTFLDSPPSHFYLLVLFLINWVSCVLFSNERIIFLPLRQEMLRYFLDMLTEQQTTTSVPLAVWMWQTGYCPVSIWKRKKPIFFNRTLHRLFPGCICGINVTDVSFTHHTSSHNHTSMPLEKPEHLMAVTLQNACLPFAM